jgi:hypothetical protein
MLQAFSDVERMLKGSAIQARCLECPIVAGTAPPPPRNGFAAWLRTLLG